jgi:hypothetical protein
MIGYVAKDKNNEVYLHSELPEYNDTYGGWFSQSDPLNITGEFPEFDKLSYKDNPVKVEVNLTRV